MPRSPTSGPTRWRLRALLAALGALALGVAAAVLHSRTDDVDECSRTAGSTVVSRLEPGRYVVRASLQEGGASNPATVDLSCPGTLKVRLVIR